MQSYANEAAWASELLRDNEHLSEFQSGLLAPGEHYSFLGYSRGSHFWVWVSRVWVWVSKVISSLRLSHLGKPDNQNGHPFWALFLGGAAGGQLCTFFDMDISNSK